MDINLAGLASTSQNTNVQRSSDTLAAAIQRVVSNNANTSTDNIPNVSLAAQLQASSSGLRQISGNIAQAESLVQIAGQGTSQLTSVLQQLQQLAQQADNGDVSTTDSGQLNEEFQILAGQIDQIANGTSFNGSNLLDGSVSGDNALSLDSLFSSDSTDSGSLSISDLTSTGLFGGNGALDISSAASAQQALGTLSQALNTVSTASANIGAFSQSLDYASANVQSAAFNQQAATSSINDSDFASAASGLSSATLQQNLSIALAAQGNQLSPKLLDLINA